MIAPATAAVDLVAQRILLVVVLVIVLGRIERAGRADRGDHGLLQHVARVELLLRGRRLRELLVARREDRGGVLRAAVAELAARVGRVDVAPEHLEQLRIAHALRVVLDLHRLDMPGLARRDLLVARVHDRAARVARGGREHARQRVERRLHAPEAAAREDRDRALGRRGLGDRRLGRVGGDQQRDRAGRDQRAERDPASRALTCAARAAPRPRARTRARARCCRSASRSAAARRRTRGPGARRSARSGTRCAAGSA